MAKSKQDKKKLIDSYVKDLNDASATFVITPTGINPNEANEIRQKLNDASLRFIKNTLFKIALKDANKSFDDIEFKDQKAILFSKGDASANAKILFEHLKEIKKGEILGGLLKDNILTKEEVEELANLPTKDVMIATTVGAIGSPLTGFVRVVNAPLSDFVSVLKNISDNKSE